MSTITGNAEPQRRKSKFSELFDAYDQSRVRSDLKTFFGPNADVFLATYEKMRAQPPLRRSSARTWSWPVFLHLTLLLGASWAEFAALFCNTRSAFLDHERAKSELKALMPEDAKESIGHGVKAKRSKSGAVSFDVLETEATHAPVQ